jgi:hypothetical protein
VPIVYCLAATCGPIGTELERLGVSVRTIGGRGLRRARRLARQLRDDRVALVHMSGRRAGSVLGSP